jgi:hypothetical protein
MFTERDVRQLEERGIDPAAAERQIERLRNPPRPVALARAATVGDGISRLDPAEQELLESAAAAPAAAGRLMAFVPASGAASRMFKDLRAALDSPEPPSESEAGRGFFEGIDSFAFAGELRRRAGSIEPRTPDDERRILRTLLDELGYAETPKGLIPFHRTPEGPRTAFEEHLLQARRFLRAGDGTVRAHFTVAAEHKEEFERALERIRPRIEATGCRLLVDFSVQRPSTDALALDESGDPFRTSDGSLLFRPAGHGALLENLEAAGGDVVIIRNIDNVVRDEASGEVVRWKRILVGALVRLQREVFDILGACDRGAGEDALARGLRLAKERFGRVPRRALESSRETAEFVRAALERPIRVCGVVRNEGEPGGAPFWVTGPDGASSLQIVESSQVDLGDPDQKKIWSSSTHFNPVDIVAGMRRRDGEPFALASFVDPDAVLVAKKSHEGSALLALEIPGLWNGGMAGWNSLFVEVPAETFAPVKTVLDLLRPAHSG